MVALDGAPHGIRCNCVCPGDIAPGMAGRSEPAENWPLPPLGRIGEASDVAAAVAWLVSDEADWITGAALAVDGGMRAGYGTGYLRPPSSDRAP
jgi:NAD(P)-dependent dehydrogenase (short-subunit alcohol dehydrogenase family)